MTSQENHTDETITFEDLEKAFDTNWTATKTIYHEIGGTKYHITRQEAGGYQVASEADIEILDNLDEVADYLNSLTN